ncbi:hypothetical protein Cni_G04190 [Canna indica]|uniref:Uncharacterized protein n=1 Tax=Canna indica TaxID=4628 RepID=A0AAQ3Q492_9LILI|nr:hypothetical protein Cni_G04190 [Canna indica]
MPEVCEIGSVVRREMVGAVAAVDPEDVGERGPSLWNFVILAPNIGAYIAIGFYPNGRMIGSNAMAGWVSSSVGVAKQYSLGEYTSTKCPPDQGSLPLVKESSGLYLAFQLNAAQPQ